MDKKKLTQKLEETASKLDGIPLIPVRVKTLGIYQPCQTRAYLHFLFSLLPFVECTQKRSKTTSPWENIKEHLDFDFESVSVIEKPEGDIIRRTQRGLPLPRSIRIGETEFQIQGSFDDVMVNEENQEVRVIELKMIEQQEPSPLTLQKAKFQARAKSWILSAYRDDLKAPSVAIINKKKRHIPFQELIPFSPETTRMKLKAILEVFTSPSIPKRNKDLCEKCQVRDFCSQIQKVSSFT